MKRKLPSEISNKESLIVRKYLSITKTILIIFRFRNVWLGRSRGSTGETFGRLPGNVSEAMHKGARLSGTAGLHEE